MKANFAEANLLNANLTAANLEEAENITIDQLSKVKTLYNAKIDPELEHKLRAKGYSNLFEKP